jgi:ribonucleotide reductase alpha subunit
MEMMRVIKRNGETEEVSFDKVLNRIKNISDNLSANVFDIAQKVCSRIYDNVKTSELDELAAHICSSMITDHPDYGSLAARIIVSNHHKNTSPSFSETINILYNNVDVHGEKSQLVSDDVYEIVMKNKEKLNSYLKYERDYLFDYFGFKTLERAYLMKVNGVVVERPQQMFMRVALGIHGSDIKEALLTYDLMSQKFFTHATPTLFNSGTPRPQLSSCFLIALQDDSIEGIFNTLKECALISKFAGGIGVHIHNVRGKGSRIRGTNGISSGIVPMLRVFNNTARYVDQAGRRAGSIAVYIEPWHCDVEPFLEMKKNHGSEEERARDLFYALWIPDLFMERVKNDMMWSLMCPDECPGLSDVYGDEFVKLYERYEREGRYKKQIRAQELWWQVLQSQIEQGTPYLLFKDAANRKSNQKNLGTIKSSNLCSEILEYSSPDETAVCNLASIALPSYIDYDEKNKPVFNFQKLHDVAKVITKNLNKVIDVNFYPVENARRSNFKHRPIGIGVQGLADTFVLMRYPFDSPEAMKLNKHIFETIYHGAMESSMEISKKRGEYIEKYNNEEITYDELDEKIKMNEYEVINTKYPGAYSTFEGSPTSQGVFQFDLWGVVPDSGMYNWAKLKEEVMQYGIRNSLLLAPMPTASTSQILGFNECFEPFTSNLYKRRTMAGEFIIVNKYLIADLVKLDLWNKDMKNKLMITDGSVQSIPEIPDALKALYKTGWELRQKVLVDQSADRGAFVCQSQSLNLFVEDPDFKKLSSMHFYSWQKGLKTGIYYLRTRAKAQAQKFTIDPSMVKLTNIKVADTPAPTPKTVVCDGDTCEYCSG